MCLLKRDCSVSRERIRTLEGILAETKNKEEEKKTLTNEFRRLKNVYDTKNMELEKIKSKIRSKNEDREHLQKNLDDVERFVLIYAFSFIELTYYLF